MKTRIIVGLAGLALLLLVVLVLPAMWTAVLVAAMSVIAVYELLIGTGLLKHVRIFVYCCLMSIMVVIWSALGMPRPMGSLMSTVFLLALFGELLAAHTELKFRSVCLAIFAGAVLPFLLGALVRLRYLPNGAFYIITAFLLAMVPDTGAYFAGSFFGKHKLCPIISPKKTVEGAVGGVAGAALLGVIYAFAVNGGNSVPQFALICAAGAVISMIGDLAASAIKRDKDIKDYGTLIPGHGGILDRFDSVIFTAPVIYFLHLLLVTAPVR